MTRTLTLLLAAPLATLAVPAIAQDLADPPIVVTGKYLETWQDAQKDEQDALEDLEEAREKLMEANEEILEEDEDRNRRADNAKDGEDRFRKLVGNVPVFTGAKDAKDWADKVEDAADDWAKAVSNGRDDQRELRSAMKDQRKYQRRVEKAQKALDTARRRMAEAERRARRADAR